MLKSRVLLIYTIAAIAYFIDRYILKTDAQIQQAWLPVALAAINVGAQVAKGIKASNTAKKIRKDANNIYKQGIEREKQAKLARTPFAVSNEFKDAMQRQLSDASVAANTNSVEANLNKITDANTSAATSAMKRGSTSSAQYGANVLALQKQQNADNLSASITGQQVQNQNRQQLAQLLGIQGQMDMYAWEKNTEAPWLLDMTRAMQEQNTGLEGKVASRYLQQDAFNSYMNGLSSAASAGFDAIGGFDFKGFGNGSTVKNTPPELLSGNAAPYNPSQFYMNLFSKPD